MSGEPFTLRRQFKTLPLWYRRRLFDAIACLNSKDFAGKIPGTLQLRGVSVDFVGPRGYLVCFEFTPGAPHRMEIDFVTVAGDVAKITLYASCDFNRLLIARNDDANAMARTVAATADRA